MHIIDCDFVLLILHYPNIAAKHISYLNLLLFAFIFSCRSRCQILLHQSLPNNRWTARHVWVRCTGDGNHQRQAAGLWPLAPLLPSSSGWRLYHEDEPNGRTDSLQDPSWATFARGRYRIGVSALKLRHRHFIPASCHCPNIFVRLHKQKRFLN